MIIKAAKLVLRAAREKSETLMSLRTRVSNSATFRDSVTGKKILSRDKGTTGQKILHYPGTKGQQDNFKILPREGTGRDSQNTGRDGPGQSKSVTGRGTKRDRAEKDVLKQKNYVLKQKKIYSDWLWHHKQIMHHIGTIIHASDTYN